MVLGSTPQSFYPTLCLRGAALTILFPLNSSLSLAKRRRRSPESRRFTEKPGHLKVPRGQIIGQTPKKPVHINVLMVNLLSCALFLIKNHTCAYFWAILQVFLKRYFGFNNKNNICIDERSLVKILDTCISDIIYHF